MKIKVLDLCLMLLPVCQLSIAPVIAAQPATPSSPQGQQVQKLNAAPSQYDIALIKAYMDEGRLYAQGGQNQKARAAYIQGLTLSRQQLPANHPLIGLFLVQLSTTYMLEQNFDKACSLLSEGISVLDKTPAFQPKVQQLKSLELLLSSFQDGLVALKNQNYPLAEKQFTTALTISQQIGEPTIISVSLSSIGIAQSLQDKSQEGEQSLRQAFQYAEATHMKEAKTMALLGFEELYARRGEIELAKKSFDEAVTEGSSLFARLNISNAFIDQEYQRLHIIEEALNTAQASVTATDYLSDALFHNKVMRWNDQTRTIKIYIAPGNQIAGWKPEYIDQFKKACLTWQTTLDNQIQFEFTDNATDNVDTTITWTGDYAARAGLTRYNFVSNKLTKADIQFNLGTFDHQLFDTRTVYKIALHELGHLLGIVGHSKNPKDVMYPTITLVTQPSARDIATIHQLYAKAPDISNPVGFTLGEYRKTRLKPTQKMLIEALDHF